ncbi:hypothetical protein RIF24_17025 (plasmid) [Exiguobacterium acetylicum]
MKLAELNIDGFVEVSEKSELAKINGGGFWKFLSDLGKYYRNVDPSLM